jgi:hypothetical protein
MPLVDMWLPMWRVSMTIYKKDMILRDGMWILLDFFFMLFHWGVTCE